MKSSPIITTLLAFAFIVSGCASSESTTHSDKTLEQLNSVGKHLNNILQQLNSTENALSNISNASESELEDAYDNFRGNISTLANMRDELNSRLENLQNTSSQYLTQWRQEAQSYNNQDLREKSEERRQELNESFSKLMDNGSNVSRQLENFLSDMREVRSYLSNDLTVQGADAATNSEQYEKSAREARQAIEEMQKSMSEVRQNMGGGSPLSK